MEAARKAAGLQTLKVEEEAFRFIWHTLQESKSFDNPHLSSTNELYFLKSRECVSVNITLCTLNVSTGFEALVERYILKSQKNRTPRLGGLICDLFQVVPELAAKLITAIWTAVGRLAFVPKIFQTTTLPIHKAGHPTHPFNQRATALIFRIRK